ncbi:MAG: GNAT family N-acetyltransferase [Bacteroidota bacterium]|nr:GNAT family N-acetyltransferase [Bacteroidota bacterium]
MNYEVAKNNYLISTDKNKIDISYVHGVLSQTYWSPGVSISVVKKAMKGSLCFGVHHRNKQIGYARLVTDKATFGYLADVFIDKKYQGKGLAKWLVETIMAHPDLQGLRRILLATKDAHGLYEKLGFIPVSNPERFMVCNPTGYKSK